MYFPKAKKEKNSPALLKFELVSQIFIFFFINRNVLT